MPDARMISVSVPDRTVTIDGVPYQIENIEALMPHVHSIQWDGSKNWGHVSRTNGDSHGFNDQAYATLLAPYVFAWQKARADAVEKLREQANAEKERIAKLQAEQEQRLKAEAEARAAHVRDREAYNHAVAYLDATDHEIVKAMEAKLCEGTRLAGGPPLDERTFTELVEKRRKARETAKAEKIRLKLQNPWT